MPRRLSHGKPISPERFKSDTAIKKLEIANSKKVFFLLGISNNC